MSKTYSSRKIHSASSASSIYEKNKAKFSITPENVKRMANLIGSSSVAEQEPGNLGEFMEESLKRVLSLANSRTGLKNVYPNKILGKD